MNTHIHGSLILLLKVMVIYSHSLNFVFHHSEEAAPLKAKTLNCRIFVLNFQMNIDS